MLDINIVREKTDLVRESIKKRFLDDKLPIVDEVLKMDKRFRELKNEADELKHERNDLSRKIADAKKGGKDAAPLLKRASELPKKVDAMDEELAKLETQIRERLMKLPNLTHESVPLSKDEAENAVIRTFGKPVVLKFELKSHGELAEALGCADFTRSTKLSGAGFYFLKGGVALLNLGLIRFAVEYLVKKGFTYVEPPLMIRRKPYEGVIDLKDFEDVMYKIEGEDSYLIATSEHPMVAQFMDEVILEKDLPIKFAGYSMCFRKEIGSHGVDTRGLFRTHQFNKVEQVVFCKPGESWKIFDEICANTEGMYQLLEIPYRIINTVSGALSIVTAMRYDLEVWMPRQKEYKEAASCSNCLDYQARRLNIRYFDSQGNRIFPHSLNNTAIATSRALVAILENYQNQDGSITVPKVLQPYVGMKIIK